MEQRRLRLGDILDDYCPRERRVTNHVVVAMIEDDVKQTRCSTCDADHEYKQAKVPQPRRRKEAGALTGEAAENPRARRPELAEAIEVADEADDPSLFEVVSETLEVGQTSEMETGEPEPLQSDPVEPEREDDGPVHRRLIRATLPRPEGQVPERKETEFTVRQQSGRGQEMDGNRPQGQRHRRPQRGGERQGDMRFGGSPQGNQPRGGGGGGDNRGNRAGGGPPRQGQGQPGGGGQPGGQPGGQRPSRPGGENRFRRRRGR